MTEAPLASSSPAFPKVRPRSPSARRAVIKAYAALLDSSPKRGVYWLCRVHRPTNKTAGWSGPFPYPWDAWAAARRHEARSPGPHDLRVLEVWP